MFICFKQYNTLQREVAFLKKAYSVWEHFTICGTCVDWLFQEVPSSCSSRIISITISWWLIFWNLSKALWNSKYIPCFCYPFPLWKKFTCHDTLLELCGQFLLNEKGPYSTSFVNLGSMEVSPITAPAHLPSLVISVSFFHSLFTLIAFFFRCV